MTRYISKLFLSIFILTVVFPSQVQATGNAGDYINAKENQVVSRGDFVRASIKALGIQTSKSKRKLPYLRIPKALRSYVEVAHDRRALDMFGNDLQLARGITRGQALVILVKIKSLKSNDRVRFRDVRSGTPEAGAVSVSQKLGWMTPQSKSHFGVRRMLKGSEAKLLLRRVTGEVVPDREVPERLQPIRSSTFAPTKATVKIKSKEPQYVKVRLTGVGTNSSSRLPKHQILETIWRYINDNFVYPDNIDPEKAAYMAAEALVNSLGDKYSTFLRPSGISNLETQIRGTVTGIGAQVEQKDGILTIVTPLRSSPAEAAGLKPKDQIIKADGVDLTTLGFMEAVDRVRGPKGSTVLLTIRRNGNEFEVEVKRDEIKVPEIDITWQGTIAVVKLLQFGKTTENELRGLMAQVQSKNPSGVILDLRSNPGGLLKAANVVLSNFLPKGTDIASIVSRDRTRVDATTVSPTIRQNIPLIILVNEGSASASEIVAGALQDHNRATIVGVNTFGKGTVQQVVRFNDESGLKVTIAEWHTPNGKKIDENGIRPDLVVKYTSERDEQMLKALELLR
ncbi:MAG: S41 family peptidase [Candidatus Peribacteraceae bacterium]|jgi:carboxyl-terminal processing protease|nr:S41 family peptidase [Candidatus Peribacteraceae bacterium]HCI04302.1 hypothetical protein [Candidatus Peribacteria bacterium]